MVSLLLNLKYPVVKINGNLKFKIKSGKMYNINDTEEPDHCEDIFVKNTQIRAIMSCVGLWISSSGVSCQ